jgi:hypothetical protein
VFLNTRIDVDGDHIVEKNNDTFSAIDIIDEEENNASYTKPTTSVSAFADFTANLMSGKTRKMRTKSSAKFLNTKDGCSNDSRRNEGGSSSSWLKKFQRVKFKIRKLGQEQVVKIRESLYGRLFEKFHEKPEMEEKYDNLLHQVDLVDRKKGVAQLKKVINTIMYKLPENRSFLEIQLVYEVIKYLSFWNVLCVNSTDRERLQITKHIRLFEMYDNSSRYVFQKGDKATCFYILTLGNLSVYATKNIHGEIVEECKKKLSPGSCFGLMAVLNETQNIRLESIRIEEASPKECLLKPECFVIPKDIFDSIVHKTSTLNSSEKFSSSKSANAALPISRIFKCLSETPPFDKTWDWFKAYKNAVYFNPRTFSTSKFLSYITSRLRKHFSNYN